MNGTPVFVGSGFVASYLEGGGSFWIPLQYLRGFRDHGIECYWLEVLRGSGDRVLDRRRVDAFLRQASRLWPSNYTLVLYLPEAEGRGRAEFFAGGSVTVAELAETIRRGVLLNFNNHVPREQRQRFGRTVLYDIDPGMMQLWSRQSDMGIGDHDLYVSIGRGIGTVDCRVPDGGVPWQHLWPAVHLPSWPTQEAEGSRYSTVTHWWNGNRGYDLIDGELYEHNKRTSFMEVLDLPRRTGLELELAAYVTPGEVEDRDALSAAGWRLVDPREVTATPWAYRFYIQGSRGEFSCAKPSVVKTAPGWVSDRTICYLASGRPCVVQDAGASRYLPETLGLQFFSTIEQAAVALREAERHRAMARRQARMLAEEFFSTRVIIPKLIRLAGIERARAAPLWHVRRRAKSIRDERRLPPSALQPPVTHEVK